jgi:hypothetical protein
MRISYIASARLLFAAHLPKRGAFPRDSTGIFLREGGFGRLLDRLP